MMKPRLHAEGVARSSSAPLAWPGDDIETAGWAAAWVRVAANSFGGPAGQIAVMHEEIVVRQAWVSERRFLHALNYCMLLPGPEAQQLATYLGWMLRGPAGGLFAGAIFILPGFVSIMALSILYARVGDVPWVAGMFDGITAAVIAIVAGAVVRIGTRVITNAVMAVVAASAFVAVFLFDVPFPVVVAAAITTGVIGGRIAPPAFVPRRPPPGGDAVGEGAALVDDDHESLAAPTLRRTMRVLVIGAGAWATPIAVVLLLAGRGSVFLDVAWFFSSAAVLTFGGAYSVLAYISDAAVTGFGWLEPHEMLSGLAMAETTPGPLIQVVQFVGFMGPYRDPGGLTPMAAGVLGAVIATWVTFAPSFLWIFLGAPYIEQLHGRRSLTAAMTTVTAAVVGVVANLAVWFTTVTLFDQTRGIRWWGLTVDVPVLATIDRPGVVITAAALIAVFWLRVPTATLVIVAGLVGVIRQALLP